MSRPLVLGPFPVPHLHERRVRLHLPPRRDEGSPPLIVMFDGQNLFHDDPSASGGWHLHETARKLVTKRRPEPAIAGIDHGGAERIHELSPWPAEKSHGKLNHLLDWVIAFLMPMLAREYGLSPDLDRRIIGGSSMGGLAALYAHHRHPETFGGVLAMSPSLWIAGQRIFDMVSRAPKPWTSRIYLDAGACEGGGSMLRAAERMASLLQQRGYEKSTLRFRADPKGHHNEKAWRRRAPAALRFLLPAGKRG